MASTVVGENGTSLQRVSSQAGELQRRAPDWFWDLFAYAPAAAMVPLGAAGVAGLLGRGPRLLRDHKGASALLTAGAVAGLAYWQMSRWFTEQPEYEIEYRGDGFEVRRYEPRVVAETTVHGLSWDDALSEGFRRLAGYIYGGNAGEQRLAMTAPVNARRGERLAMTSPVTAAGEDGGLVVTFTMPKDRSLGSLPDPSDDRVRLGRQDGQRVAALRFRGTYDGRRTQEMQAELLRRVRVAGEQTVGEPSFAGYDSPSTLPFLRRVEVWVPIA